MSFWQRNVTKMLTYFEDVLAYVKVYFSSYAPWHLGTVIAYSKGAGHVRYQQSGEPLKEDDDEDAQ